MSSDGTTIAMVSPFSGGHLRIYKWSGSSWGQMGSDITGEQSEDGFAERVSINSDGTIVAASATGNDGVNGTNSGHVRVFQWSGSSWNQVGADIDGEVANDYSGRSVSLSSDGTILAVGAPYNDGNGSNSGHVRVHKFSNGSWSQMGSDIDGKSVNSHFGNLSALSSDGTILAVGGNDGGVSQASIYQWSGSSWNKIGSDINEKASGDGIRLSISGDGKILAIAGMYNDDVGNNAGHVHVYQIKQMPTLTFKTAGSHYLRYKATDAAGNETPNDANHYLTMTVTP